ncbi:unnamed protein product [Dovyalis caffra]|uniref:Uncharacterized protein n=1 Tax=Dovyalis caffra TaxID=77055 RepID=A0AAV1ST38_9ROSI|nr:unnamed protein product [Dovyalis caffra]
MSDDVQRSEATKLLKEARKARGCPRLQARLFIVIRIGYIIRAMPIFVMMVDGGQLANHILALWLFLYVNGR